MSDIHVTSEVKKLKKVMVHRPGKELLNLSPTTLEKLSYDDMPYLADAQIEHDDFVAMMRNEGIEVIYLEDLVAETLAFDPSVREKFIQQYISEANLTSDTYKEVIYDFLNAIKDCKELVLRTMEGISIDDIDFCYQKESLQDLAEGKHRMIIDAIAATFFTRDPFACLGSGVSIHKMYNNTRSRETIYGDYIFKYHPFYKDTDIYYNRENPAHIEGGDVLILNDHTLAIGLSLRTEADAIEKLASNLFKNNSKFDTILAIKIPVLWSFMHLDTVFTQVDIDKFTIHPEILGPLKLFELKKTNGDIKITEVNDTLEHILEHYLNLDHVELIPCGGGNWISAGREQFYDGTNTLCIAPGVVIVYHRNNVTNSLLREKGIRVLELHGAELSRGRGGPRCMTMPFIRED